MDHDPALNDVRALQAVLSELEKRDLLDRAQVIHCDTVTIQLGPPPLTFRPSHPANEQQPDPEDPLYAASEGYRS